jgi:hypothetical protein
MSTNKILPPGREHELEVLGVTSTRDDNSPPPVYKDFRNSMREILKSRLMIYGKDGAKVFEARQPPADKLFRSIKKFLPKRPGLSMYIPVESSLDYWHGVDLFFVWRNIYVTIDLSLVEKPLRRSVDITVDFTDMDDEAFDVLGKQIADLFILRRERNRTGEPRNVINPG